MIDPYISKRAQLFAEFDGMGLLEDEYTTVPMPVVALPTTHRRGQLWRFVDYQRTTVEELDTVKVGAARV